MIDIAGKGAYLFGSFAEVTREALVLAAASDPPEVHLLRERVGCALTVFCLSETFGIDQKSVRM